jgi:uncharacterized membrane protein YdjX (TVP38/TMEM64 family)
MNEIRNSLPLCKPCLKLLGFLLAYSVLKTSAFIIFGLVNLYLRNWVEKLLKKIKYKKFCS